jgi:putative tryptophan/tyrosine transport system substrate-binding protein
MPIFKKHYLELGRTFISSISRRQWLANTIGLTATTTVLTTIGYSLAKSNNTKLIVIASDMRYGERHINLIRQYSGEFTLLKSLGYRIEVVSTKVGDWQFNTERALEVIQKKPDILVTIADDETNSFLPHFPNTPIICLAQFDPVSSGLVKSLDRPGGNITGITFDTLHCPKALEFLRACLPNRAINCLVVCDRDWLVEPRLISWQTVAKSLGITLFFEAVQDIESLKQSAVWLRPKDFDVWLMPFSRVQATDSQVIVDHLNLHGVLSYFERLVAVIEGAALGFEDTITDSERSIGELIIRVAQGEHPSEIAIRSPDAWMFAVNERTLKQLKITLPEVAKNMISRVF